jgi:inorganic pyrophosphatase
MHNHYKAHPWHGISPGANVPNELVAFIEIIPTDTVKYEIDKTSGYLKIDRPQKFSNVVPALYGFIPRTYCKENTGRLCRESTGKEVYDGDGDPLDICILTERVIPHGDILVNAIPIGGLRLIDNHEADDKIIAVLKDDDLYGKYTDLDQLPSAIVDRLQHYFLTYKQLPSETERKIDIAEIYGADTAKEVILASMLDYNHHFSK